MKAIILMTRLPIPGATKTRLMPHLNGEACASLHDMFLRDYARCFKGVSGEAEIIIAYAPEHFSDDVIVKMPFSECKWFLQKGNTLGERMCHAFSYVEQLGFNEIVLVGADLPHLQPSHFDQAFELLKSKDVVLGPTLDGGYYLIGMKKTYEGLFSDHVKWGTQSVYDATCYKAEQLGLSVGEVTSERDVDTLEDLLALKEQLEHHKSDYAIFPEHTYHWICEQFDNEGHL